MVDEASRAIDAIQSVGPGGHFFGTEHTLLRFEHAFYEPMLSDWRNFENWQEGGAKTGTERANAIWKERLRTYEAPPLDQAISDELDAYVVHRKEQIGVGKLNATSTRIDVMPFRRSFPLPAHVCV